MDVPTSLGKRPASPSFDPQASAQRRKLAPDDDALSELSSPRMNNGTLSSPARSPGNQHQDDEPPSIASGDAEDRPDLDAHVGDDSFAAGTSDMARER